LSFERAPPISVPMRFFLTAPIFGALASLALVAQGHDALAGRWTPALLGVTHLYTLGVLTMVMCGAMFQMLPVVAGSPVSRPVAIAWIVHPSLVLGAAGLGLGMLRGSGAISVVAAVALAIGLSVYLCAAALSLARVRRVQDSVRGIALAHLALSCTLVLGIWLAAGHGLESVALRRAPMTDLHAAWGAIGWVAVLIVAVGYQVVPMFQLTPEYPPPVRLLLAPALVGLLVVWSTVNILPDVGDGVVLASGLGLAAALALFAACTLRIQALRRRRRADTTLEFWRLGLGALGISIALWVVSTVDPNGPALVSAGIAYLVGFTLSVVTGMLYKIVPFLVWLHLQRRRTTASGAAAAPTMGAILPAARARWQLRAHATGVLLLIAAPWWPAVLTRPAALVLLGSFVLLGVNLSQAMRVHARH
jgi:hypothetical protein